MYIGSSDVGVVMASGEAGVCSSGTGIGGTGGSGASGGDCCPMCWSSEVSLG
jgi:hypothetical protein